MNFNDLFFTLLLYRKAKTRQYRFYDCLVSHDGAYIDVNRVVEPSETLSIAFKVYPEDWDTAITRPMYPFPQQWILCARRDKDDPNTVMISPYYGWDESYSTDIDPDSGILIDNGDGINNRRILTVPWFGKKIVAILRPKGKVYYNANTEEYGYVEDSITTPRSLDGGRRALLKLFAGFEPGNGGLIYNTVVSRIYYFYIQNSNQEYTLRLQPAENLNTGELGMYDSINDKFYPNKNSIGYFTVENNITDKIILDVESQIDTSLYKVLCTSNVMPYKTSDNKLYLLRK